MDFWDDDKVVDDGSCWECGGKNEPTALLTGKPPYEKSCPNCGAELCPRCGHRHSLHTPMAANPLRDECQCSRYGDDFCGCWYYKSDVSKELEFSPLALGELLG